MDRLNSDLAAPALCPARRDRLAQIRRRPSTSAAVRPAAPLATITIRHAHASARSADASAALGQANRRDRLAPQDLRQRPFLNMDVIAYPGRNRSDARQHCRDVAAKAAVSSALDDPPEPLLAGCRTPMANVYPNRLLGRSRSLSFSPLNEGAELSPRAPLHCVP